MATSMLEGAPATPAVTPPVTEAPAAKAPETPVAPADPSQDWRSAIPEDLRKEPSLQTIPDLPTLFKSYVHAQRMTGAEKIPLPSKHATEDDWKNVFKKIGLPEKFEEYKVEANDKEIFGDAFMSQFKENAYKLNILPKQAQGLIDWYGNVVGEQKKSMELAVEQDRQETEKTLKKEWGVAFDAKLNAAANALKELAGERYAEVKKVMESKGWGNNAELLRVFAKAGELMKEDHVRGQATGAVGRTPRDAEREWEKIKGDKTHPFWNKTHTNFLPAQQEVSRLFAEMNPET